MRVVEGLYVWNIKVIPLIRTYPRGLGAGISGLWHSRYCSVVYSVSSSTKRIALTTMSVRHLRIISCSGNIDFQRTSLACKRPSIRCDSSSGRGSALLNVSPSSADSAGDRGHTISTGSEARRPSRMSVCCRCNSLDFSVQDYLSAPVQILLSH